MGTFGGLGRLQSLSRGVRVLAVSLVHDCPIQSPYFFHSSSVRIRLRTSGTYFLDIGDCPCREAKTNTIVKGYMDHTVFVMFGGWHDEDVGLLVEGGCTDAVVLGAVPKRSLTQVSIRNYYGMAEWYALLTGGTTWFRQMILTLLWLTRKKFVVAFVAVWYGRQNRQYRNILT
jgi:hypothetical protein